MISTPHDAVYYGANGQPPPPPWALPKVGDRIRLVGDHPWAGRSGTVVKHHRRAGFIGESGALVHLDAVRNVDGGRDVLVCRREDWAPERRES